jgi:hypothetical protein
MSRTQNMSSAQNKYISQIIWDLGLSRKALISTFFSYRTSVKAYGLLCRYSERGNTMIDSLQLQEMKSVDITQADRSKLVDIKSVHIDSSLPAAQKVKGYIEQIKNPYCFLCGDTPVRIRFVSETRTLKKSLSDYFLSLK